MSKYKKTDATENYEQQRAYREMKASKLADEWPNVEQVLVKLSFRDFEEKRALQPKNVTYAPESRAHFELKCPYWECVMGGFDFSRPVREAVENQQSLAKASIQCSGWQDRERINKHRCRLRADVEIEVKYKNAV